MKDYTYYKSKQGEMVWRSSEDNKWDIWMPMNNCWQQGYEPNVVRYGLKKISKEEAFILML